MTEDELAEELGFALRDHDVRIARGPWVYWVRGVKSVESLRRHLINTAGGFGEALVLGMLAGLLELWWRRRRRWKVGVVRVASSRWGPTGRISILYKEVLPSGVDPAARIAEVAARVRSGEFDGGADR